MQEMTNITRKIKLSPIGDKNEIKRVYEYIRNGQYAQNKASNQYISSLYIQAIKNFEKEDRKELSKLYTRYSDSEKGSAYDDDIIFAKGLSTTSEIFRRVTIDFNKSINNGLLKGNVSIPNYKLDNPLWVSSKFIKFIHEYDSNEKLIENMNSSDFKVMMKFVNNIKFSIVFGNPNKSLQLRNIFKNIFEEKYKICESSIQIYNRDIILNLSISIPKIKKELNENIVVGVDLGLEIPAMCGLNNNKYIKKEIGSKEDFLRVRTKIQSQKRQLQKSLKYSNGGHGRKKKMKPMNRFLEYERNFVKTYNHMISKNIIDFAIKNNAKYINMEDLSGFDSNKFVLRNWSYYELQQYVIYKASKNGVIVRFINPYHTSQICSECGNWEEGQRLDQSHFKCKKCGYKENADFNASRNIAKSEDFV
jgi:IS605 OrfB family transposase